MTNLPPLEFLPSDAEVLAALDTCWLASETPRRSIATLIREPFGYTSSFPLEELTVELDTGERYSLILKNLSLGALAPKARRAKPEFLDNPRREIVAYQQLLAGRELGTARCYAAFSDSGAMRSAIFLEKLDGRELYQVGELATWEAVARWLARFHTLFSAPENIPAAARAELLQHDAAYYATWMTRAQAFLSARSVNDEPFTQLAADYPQIAEELSRLPQTVIHGEFYASNVMVSGAAELRISPIDWERTAIGPGVIDLAALTAGKWSEAQKLAFAECYWRALGAAERGYADWPSFERALWLARLHLAVQWLGWSDDWRPPSEHRQDWRQEALAAWTVLR